MSNGFAAARKTLVHEHELKIAKQHLSSHAVAADVVHICKSCPGPLHRRERAYAGSREGSARMLVVET